MSLAERTRDREGTWRSQEGRTFFQLHKAAGEIYRQELAAAAERLGYALAVGKESTFELAGVPEAALKAFSHRAAQIEAHLAERGKTRETASAAERQMATLDTRMAKEAHDRADLVTAWSASADAAGFDREARFALMDQGAERRSVEDRLAKQGEAEAAARAAVGFAAEKLGERQSVFSAAELEKEAGRRLMGRAGQYEVLGAIGRAAEVGDLEARIHSDRRGAEGAGFTTRQNIAGELALLRAEYRGRSMAQPIAGPVEAARIVASAALAAKDQGHAWTADQQATRAILVSRNQVVAVQGCWHGQDDHCPGDLRQGR